MVKIELPMEALSMLVQAAMPAASDDKENLALHGVCLQVVEGELQAIATDNMWIARIRHRPEHADAGFRMLIPMRHCKKLVALIGNEMGPAVVARDETLARITLHNVGSLEIRFGLAEVPFPSTERYWPTGPSKALTRIGLNPKLMARLAKSFKVASGTHPALEFAFRGEQAPVVVSCDVAPHCTALLMPCALNDEESPDRQGKLFDRNGSDAEQAEQ